MRNAVVVAFIAGCWTGSSPRPAAPAQSPEAARAQALEQARKLGVLGFGDQSYGGAMYGGAFANLTGTGDISSGFDDSNIYGGLIGTADGTVSTGGFGVGTVVTGPGDGGGYGTIGHGSGTGSGYGVGGGRGGIGGRHTPLPTVTIGQATITGDLDKAIIRRYIKRNVQKISYCYEKELVSDAKLAGTVMAKFKIGTDGLVSSSKATGVSNAVSTCVGEVIKGIEFPKPQHGTIDVTYPLVMNPS
jgi:hypothetical protein